MNPKLLPAMREFAAALMMQTIEVMKTGIEPDELFDKSASACARCDPLGTLVIYMRSHCPEIVDLALGMSPEEQYDRMSQFIPKE